jgi:4-hydroxybenzoate polyprenyltransferase
VALAALSLVQFTEFTFHLKGLFFYKVMAVLFTCSVYNFMMLFGLPNHSLHSEKRIVWYSKNFKSLIYLSTIMFLAGLLFIFSLNYITILLLFFSGIISILYFVPIIKGSALRNFIVFKMPLIAFVWTTVVCIIPWVAGFHLYETSFISITIFAMSIYFFVLGIAIPFDIRDQHIDKNSNTENLALKYEVHKVKMFSIIFFAISLIIMGIYSYYFSNNPKFILAPFLITIVISGVVVANVKETSNNLYYLLLLDLCLVLPYVLSKLHLF